MEKKEILTMREKMENVLTSAAEALMAGVNMKTVVKQLDEAGVKLNQKYERHDLVYALSVMVVELNNN